MAKTSEILYKALVSCGIDLARTKHLTGGDERMGLYELLHKEPITIVCDSLARKLKEQGYRVTKTLENENRSKK
jgi:hypothetical protein